jgi:hypothetical protein
MTEHIKVRATKPGPVALWEQHPDHPKGEVWIADDKTHEVALTSEVAKRLRDGRLVQVGAPAEPAAESEGEAPTEPASSKGRKKREEAHAEPE